MSENNNEYRESRVYRLSYIRYQNHYLHFDESPRLKQYNLPFVYFDSKELLLTCDYNL